MASQCFLKLEGVKGESHDHAHQDAIEVISWRWGATNTGTMHIARRGGAGTSEFEDLTVTKRTDKATPALWEHLATGRTISSGELIMRKGDGDPVEFLRISIEQVLVTGIGATGAEGGPHASEEVRLNFARWTLVYTPQEPDGTPGPEEEFGFDIARNERR